MREQNPEAQLTFYQERGYVVLDEIVPMSLVESLREETLQLCRGRRGTIRDLPTAKAPKETDDVLRLTLCIHFPHKISTLMHDMLGYPAVVDVLTGVIGPNVKCMQSMLFIKSAGKPGQAWHQDEDFIPTRDRSLTAAWITLDDATVENGCLWVIPGSHKPGVLWPMEVQRDPRFDCTDTAAGFPYSDEDAVSVPVKAGSIVFFNGYLLHRSLPNRASGGYRRALVNHYMSASSLLPWIGRDPKDHIGIADHRDIVMVAGKDPYAYKGIQDLVEPHVRPSGEGGCLKDGELIEKEWVGQV